mgnify:CR=1 FL=1
MGKIVTRAQQQYVSTGIGSGEKQLAYVLRPVRYSTMGANDIVDYCAANSIVPKSYMVAAMTAIIQCIENFLLNGHSVAFPNLGTFSLTSTGYAENDVFKAGLVQLRKLNVRFLPCMDLKSQAEKVDVELDGVFDIAGETVLQEASETRAAKTQKYYKRVNRSLTVDENGDEDPEEGGGETFLLKLSVPTAMQSMGKVQIGSDTPGVDVQKNIASGQEVTIKAIPTNGDYQFISWSDGNTSSTRTLTMTEAKTLTASFSPVE